MNPLGWCECCEREAVTPYHHDNHNPPYDGYDYCAICYNVGCGGPGECYYTSSMMTPPKGTTVLSCGCGIKWSLDHNRDKSVLACAKHGIATIQEFR